ncbi:hypothetical protein ACFY7C_36240 [Streptomyces sp. NPDC012769]|uniref:hypothetical protein n=1 Tax=Streptomyces sp. NPDC012769 TaxID=3364848 RepID=UPI00368481B2
MGETLPYEALRAPTNRMRHHRGQWQAEQAQRPAEDPRKLFTEVCLHGLKARLCDGVASLDSYLLPHVEAALITGDARPGRPERRGPVACAAGPR